MKMLYFNMSKLAKKPEDAAKDDDTYLKDFKKAFSQIYDESDLRADGEKSKDMFIWNNEAFIEEKKEIVGKIHQ